MCKKNSVTETDDKIVIEAAIECTHCKGTGLYKGMAEGGASAVVCFSCNGSGSVNESRIFFKFLGRKKRTDVKRVYHTAGGFGITDVDVVAGGRRVRFSEAGASYEDWLSGKKPKPITDLHCPYIHENQKMQNSDHPQHKLYLEKCHLVLGCSITACPNYPAKMQCWKRYFELAELLK